MQKQKPTFKIPITEIRAWSSLYVACNFFLKQSSLASLLNEDVAESLDIFVSVVRTPRGSVSTGVFESWPSSTKSDSGIREVAIVFLISDDSNSNSRGTVHSSLRVERFLHLSCREASGPISVFHSSRPSEVGHYSPSAMRSYSEAAALCTCKNLVTPLTFIPR